MPADPKANRDVSHSPDPEGRVVRFRPRESVRERTRRAATPARDPDIARNRWPEPWEDYYGDDDHDKHPRRTLLNIIGVACTLLLIGVGLWLAHALVEMRQIQDCVLSGRTNCAPIEIRTSRP
jgi:hypothetical protein